MSGPLVVVGDSLLDRDVEGSLERICPDAPAPVLDEASATVRPGGAALAATLARLPGHREVRLLTALGRDHAGRALARLLAEAGVEVIDLGLDGATPEKVRLRAGGRSLLRLDRGGRGGAAGRLGAAGRAAIEWAGAVLVSDYGRGLTARPDVRRAVTARAGLGGPVIWDPHPRGPIPVPGATLATPNQAEVSTFLGGQADAGDSGLERVLADAGALREQWDVEAVCVTLGPRGALLAEARGACAIPTEPAAGDPCGAGDRFAATVAAALGDGASCVDAVLAGVEAATWFVAAGGAAATEGLLQRRSAGAPAPDRAREVVARVRAAGGTVVATGGCFDLLHAGHVRTLRAARSLGDCLVVCLNADESVRRLKGAGRPVVPAPDRAAVLEALGCVDAVVIFEEDTPEALLSRLRPDIWAKGGDHAPADLPERRVVEDAGGRVMTIPLLPGRSTTQIIEEVTTGAG